jgi:putative oxidoreductase
MSIMFKFSEKMASYGVIILRVALGIIFIAHGSQKLSGMEASIQGFQGMGLSAFVAVAVTVIELLGGIALVLGAFTRLASIGIAVVMIGAVMKVHGANGFFINWHMVPDQGHGYEYNLALLAMAVCLLCSGAGRLSVDSLFAKFQETKLQKHSYEERPDTKE